MSLRTLLGLAPTRDSFAQDLISHARRAGAAEWSYNAKEGALIDTGNPGRRVNLGNIFLEYAGADRRVRPALLQKYLAMLTRSVEIPQLWTVAAAGIYPALRSRYATLTPEIDQRHTSKPFPPQVREPWLEDVMRVLVYDFGPHMSLVPEHTAEVWGARREELWARALSNLRSLRRPQWTRLDSGLFRLASQVAYEETFVLLDEVRGTVPGIDRPVFAIPNRGVLLATNASQPAAVKVLIDAMHQHMHKSPWPLSSMLFEHADDGWRRYDPPASVAQAARSLRTLDLARTYHEQKVALDKLHNRTGTDVFVATCACRARQEEPDNIHSSCTWSSGVDTLLPKTDLIIFNSAPLSPNPDLLLVPWSAVEQVCGHHLKPTKEDPPRYRVNTFPTATEWKALQVASVRLSR